MEAKENYFFALNIPEESTEALALAQDHLPQRGVRYSLNHYFHVTLKFLGELETLPAMQAELKAKEVAKKMAFSAEELTIKFTKTGVFFRGGNPAVVWVGTYLSPTLLDFQRALDEGLNQVGFPMERKRFRPHITLARIRDIRNSEEALEDLRHLGVQKKSFQIDGFYLMKSHLTPHQPPRYEVVHEYKF